ncbi:hypothetical protein SALBM311S_09186 [Streptomyces alboniger]
MRCCSQVGLTDHADQALVVDDGEPTDLVLLHLVEHLTDIGARVDPAGGALGHLARGDLGRVVAQSDTADDDVAVGEDAAEPFVLVADGQGADVEVAHQLGGAVQGLLFGDPLGATVHDVSGGGHGVPPGAGRPARSGGGPASPGADHSRGAGRRTHPERAQAEKPTILRGDTDDHADPVVLLGGWGAVGAQGRDGGEVLAVEEGADRVVEGDGVTGGGDHGGSVVKCARM